jgi:CrcB protein
MIVLGFVVLAAAGALARWRIGHHLNRAFPTGTLLINVTGSFALGLLHNASPTVLTMVGTGGLGAFTTFSTFAHHTADLAGGGRRTAAVAYIAASVVLAVAAAGAGIAVSRGS